MISLGLDQCDLNNDHNDSLRIGLWPTKFNLWLYIETEMKGLVKIFLLSTEFVKIFASLANLLSELLVVSCNPLVASRAVAVPGSNLFLIHRMLGLNWVIKRNGPTAFGNIYFLLGNYNIYIWLLC